MLNTQTGNQYTVLHRLPPIYYKKFEIIIPAYNEEARIKSVLNDVVKFISAYNLPWQVIVSIDGNDGTEEIVNKFHMQYNFIMAIKSSGRNGKGNAIKRAVQISTADFFIIMDADNAIPFKNIINKIDSVTDCDVLILSRYGEGNKIPFFRMILSRGYNFLVRAITGLKIRDTQSGYVIANAKMYYESFKRVTLTNGFYYINLYYYLKQIGAKVKEINVFYNHAEGSKFNSLGMVIGGFVSLFAFRIRNSRFFKYVPENFIKLYYRIFKWI